LDLSEAEEDGGEFALGVEEFQQFGHVAGAIGLVGKRDVVHGADLALAEEFVPEEIDEAVSGELLEGVLGLEDELLVERLEEGDDVALVVERERSEEDVALDPRG
jgi:hypothetical protein